MKKAETHAGKYLAGNRRAFHLYQMLEKYEAGIELKGCEVKSLRAGAANLRDSFAAVKEGQLWLMNMHISPYAQGNRENPDPLRSRRLLMHKREINRLAGSIAQKGLTLIPLGLYLQGRCVKVELGLARGKHTYDKKQALKERDIKRETERAVRGREKSD